MMSSRYLSRNSKEIYILVIFNNCLINMLLMKGSSYKKWKVYSLPSWNQSMPQGMWAAPRCRTTGPIWPPGCQRAWLLTSLHPRGSGSSQRSRQTPPWATQTRVRNCRVTGRVTDCQVGVDNLDTECSIARCVEQQNQASPRTEERRQQDVGLPLLSSESWRWKTQEWIPKEELKRCNFKRSHF